MIVTEPQEELLNFVKQMLPGWEEQNTITTKCIGKKINDELVAVAAFNGYKKCESICIHLAMKCRILHRDLLRFCFQYCFNQLGVKKVYGLNAEENNKAHRLNEHLGYTFEETIEDAGKRIKVYSLTKQACKYL